MAFSWKEHKSIWKGEGIYFLTFVVAGRRKLLGTLMPVSESRWYMENVKRYSNNDGMAADGQAAGKQAAGKQAADGKEADRQAADGQEAGKQAADGKEADRQEADGQEAGKQAADGKGADRQAAGRGLAMDTSTLAVTELTPFGMTVSRELQNLPSRIEGLRVCAKQIMPDHIHVVVWITGDTGRTIRQIGNGFRIGIKKAAIALGIHQETEGHILDIPFIRTLAHRRQLRSMIDYVHANPDNAWMRQLNPALYVIQRDIELAGLHFDGMGKDRLLDYPDRQVIALSRSLTDEQIAVEVARALSRAERGTVTYTAAINAGEKAVAKAIRAKGYPLVVMMLDGFPPEGTEAASYFHPNGVYHQACGEGRLMLLAPKPANYQVATLIAHTEEELVQKAQAKGQHYTPLPHSTKRWRMIAGNVMLRMIADGGLRGESEG